MRLEVEISIDGMRDIRVDDKAGKTVSGSVSVPLVRGEKSDVVTFPDDDKG
jgi:hypothetical protein